MKVIISPDSFKGTLSALEAAQVIEQAIQQVDTTIETILLPVADGGEGTVDVLVTATMGKKYSVPVIDPLGRMLHASYGLLGDGKTAVIEMAAASGITLLQQQELNPRIATTYGTGQLIKHAMNHGTRKFIIGLGGSATNDAGTGMLRALGLRLLDKEGLEVKPSIDGLHEVVTLDFSNWDKRIKECTFLIASDVNNPLLGDKGATAIFGVQKGMNESEIPFFEEALFNWANVVEKHLDIRIHDELGAGAAGGMGGALIAFLGGQFFQGIEVVLEAMNYAEFLKEADIVITGEGQSDEQTLHGKAPFGVRAYAKKEKVPIVLVAGNITFANRRLLEGYYHEVISIVNENVSAEMAINDAGNQLGLAIKRMLKGDLFKKLRT